MLRIKNQQWWVSTVLFPFRHVFIYYVFSFLLSLLVWHEREEIVLPVNYVATMTAITQWPVTVNIYSLSLLLFCSLFTVISYAFYFTPFMCSATKSEIEVKCSARVYLMCVCVSLRWFHFVSKLDSRLCVYDLKYSDWHFVATLVHEFSRSSIGSCALALVIKWMNEWMIKIYTPFQLYQMIYK